MKFFPKLLRLLLVTLCVVADGHSSLRGFDTSESNKRSLTRRMMMMMMKPRMMMGGAGRDPQPQTGQDNTPQPARETLPNGHTWHKNIFEHVQMAENIAELEVNMTGPETAARGQEIAFTIMARNADDRFAANNVLVVDELPSEGTFISSDPEGTIVGSTLTVKLHKIAPGMAKQVQLLWRAPNRVTDLVNHAHADASNAQVTPNCEALVRVLPRDVPTAMLKVEMTAPETALFDQQVDFDILVNNTGTGTARNVSLVDKLPSEGSFVLSELAGTFDGSTITVQLGDLTPGEDAGVKVLWRTPSRSTTLVNRAFANAINAEETPDTEVLVRVRPPEEPVNCSSEVNFFETVVDVDYFGDADAITLSEAVALANEYKESYNELASMYCDPFFRTVEEVEIIAGPLQVEGGRRFLGERKFRYTKKITARCHGCSSNSNLFDNGVRRALSTFPVQGRRRLVEDECFCPVIPVAERAPTEEEFTSEYTQNVEALNLTNVDTVDNVEEVHLLVPSLQVEITAPETALFEQQVNFTILVSNTGNDTSTNVLLVNKLPSQGSFVLSEPAGTITNSALTLILNDLGPGEDVQVQVVWLTPSNKTALTNLAVASADNAEAASDEAIMIVDTPSDLRTCVAVIDESMHNNFDDSYFATKWEAFRAQFPNRNFCLLQPPTDYRLHVPPNFLNDTKAIYENVTRDDGNVADLSDWFDLCELQNVAAGITAVAVFIDISGSLGWSEIRASYNAFTQNLKNAGLAILTVDNNNEDWIEPFLTVLA